MHRLQRQRPTSTTPPATAARRESATAEAPLRLDIRSFTPGPWRGTTAPRSPFSPRSLTGALTRFAALTAPDAPFPSTTAVAVAWTPPQLRPTPGSDQCPVWQPLSYGPPPATMDDALHVLGRSERAHEADVLGLLDRITDEHGGTTAGRMWSVLRTVDPLSFFDAMTTRSACGPRAGDGGDRWLADCFERLLGSPAAYGIAGSPRVPAARQLDAINLAFVLAEPLLSRYIDGRDRRQPPFARAQIGRHSGRAIYRFPDAENRKNYFCLLPDVDHERRADDDAERAAEIDRFEAYPPTAIHELMHCNTHPNWLRVMHALPRKLRFALDESATDRAFQNVTGNTTGSAYQVRGFEGFPKAEAPGRLTSIDVADFIESELAPPSDPRAGFDRLMQCFLSGSVQRLDDLADAACAFAEQFGDVPIDRARLDRVLADLHAGRPARLPSDWRKWLNLAAWAILSYLLAIHGRPVVADAVDRWRA